MRANPCAGPLGNKLASVLDMAMGCACMWVRGYNVMYNVMTLYMYQIVIMALSVQCDCHDTVLAVCMSCTIKLLHVIRLQIVNAMALYMARWHCNDYDIILCKYMTL